MNQLWQQVQSSQARVFPGNSRGVRSQPGCIGGWEEEAGKGEARTVTGFVAVPPTVDTNNAGSTSGY